MVRIVPTSPLQGSLCGVLAAIVGVVRIAVPSREFCAVFLDLPTSLGMVVVEPERLVACWCGVVCLG